MKNELWSEPIQLVFEQRTEPCAYGNRGDWHLLRF